MKNLLLAVAFLISLQIFRQEDAWVYLRNKPNSKTYLAAPLSMLSRRALERRTRQNILLDLKDVPLDAAYYNQINAATGITVLSKSKWLNAIHVQGTQGDINNLKSNFLFVSQVEFANTLLNLKGKKSERSFQKKKNKFTAMKSNYLYGTSQTQVTMLNADFLHRKGFTGAGMLIAVIDGGFPNVDKLLALQRLRDNNQILGGYDFVNKSVDFYTGSNHGTNVLSDIAGFVEGVFVGTAPDASFYLFISEDVNNEAPLEESLWVEAAERADSLGVDIINTSLGYTTFDNDNYSHSYADMDGSTTFISRGAEIGASRGMLLVNAAGNSGSTSWKYMGAPADAAGVFTVGAVNAVENIASFSSFGPTADNRTKPDVLAHGENIFVIDHLTGLPKPSNGTSFSSPVMSGVVACFWQAFPNLTNTEVRQRIREAADRYNSPDEQYGYGVPDFKKAYETVLNLDKENLIQTITIFPNPVTRLFTIKYSSTNMLELNLKIYNLSGSKVFEKKNLKRSTVDISGLDAGVYMLKVSHGCSQKIIKIVKN
ncbi:subtilisin-like serine protease [Polaribacter irgensii 23-P]|uniref:Subtilisin-like serine protease n=1 Tax=Polaribacter irgensii 23-P TaxID=313594 RepID=A4C1P1_9FLAO|nr:S8 family serine peptidase [Polaribacter irgensii]EAR12044.1 subtilisin-like serine protease [Polaribacter irgensii 23-P]